MRENYALPRLYLDEPLTGEIALSKDHAHYLGTVLRRKPGDKLRLFNARDGEWCAEVLTVAKRAMTVKVTKQIRPPHTVPDVRLLFAPLRKHRTAMILEKATELGVHTFQLVITARTQFPKLNLERAKAQIIEAAEQTERLDLPELNAAVPLMEALDSPRPLLFADEGGGGGDPLAIEAALPLDILIGPEGGFTDEEREMIRARPGTIPVSLGPRILRADTAAIALLSLVQARLGDWKHI